MLILAMISGLLGLALFVWAALKLREAPGVERNLILAMLLGVLLMAYGLYETYIALLAMA